jgi:uncharacterized membrane protein
MFFEISGWFTAFGYDVLGLGLSVSLLGLYHLYLRIKVARNPAYTVQSVNIIARAAWVENVMREKGMEVLAVQTLRNSTMAATFLASTAVLLIMGVLTLSEQGDKLSSTWHALNVYGTSHTGLWLVKLLLLLLDLFVVFFSFTMSVRVYNHVGYMINVPLTMNHKMISPRHVAITLNRAGRFYSIGMRAFYYTVPLVFWLFGPHFMLVATAVLIAVLYRLDRAPKVLEVDYS